MLLNVQSTLRVGDTLEPLIFMSNRIHLSNIAGYKAEWPGSVTIGNLSSKIHQTPSTHGVGIVAVLLIPLKNRKIAQCNGKAARDVSRAVQLHFM
jgi:hypothetical protein